MSVVNVIAVKSIRISEETKTIFLSGSQGNHRFDFTFHCTSGNTFIAFNMDSNRMLTAIRSDPRGYNVINMRFWLDSNDMPVPSASYFSDWSSFTARISDDYRQKLAAYQLDHIIND